MTGKMKLTELFRIKTERQNGKEQTSKGYMTKNEKCQET